MADWLDVRDPWLTRRMRHVARIAHWEREIGAAIVQAMTRFLDAARAGVLGESGLTAAAEPPPPEQPPPPQEPPSLDGWPSDVVWETALTEVVLPVVAGAFDEAFTSAYRATITVSEIEPFRIIFLGTVFDRLRIWPRGAFEEIRVELADGIAAGETVDQLRNHVGRVLNIDARSRAIEDRIATLEALIDDPDTPMDQERAARAERRQLYRDKDIEDSRWQWRARRIARTETMAAYNGGALYGGEAWSTTSGEQLWKQWWSTTDTRTRPSHWVAHMQVRPLLDPFAVGGYSLRHPGDPLAPGAETINCRCALLTLSADEAAEQQALYEQMRPDRTDIDGNPLDDLGRPIVAAAQLEDIMPDAPPTDDQVDDAGDEADAAALPGRWRGILAPLDTPSGDGRIIATPEELRTRPLPVPLLYQDQLSPGHDGAIVVGTIDRAWIENGALMGEGRFDIDDPRSAEVVRRVADNFLGGISVDLDDATSETRCMRDGQLVDCDDLIEVDDDGFPVGVADGVQAVDVASTWRLMAATLVSQPAFPEARIEAIAGEQVDDDVPVAAASLVASASGWAPPREWFDNPQLPGPTPITVTNDGHVIGHLAAWSSCHTGFPGRCVPPPRDPSAGSYEYFHVGTVRCAEGADLPVGSLVIGTRHADLTDDAARAFAHYADTGQAVAAVRAGEDEHGIWIAGAVLPGVTDDQLVTLRRSPLSGDWRPIGGQQRLVAALAVNVPGFPLPRHRTDEAGRPAAMVAAGVVHRPRTTEPAPAAAAVMPSAEAIAGARFREIQAAAARTRHAGQLRRRMTGPRVAALAARIGRQ